MSRFAPLVLCGPLLLAGTTARAEVSPGTSDLGYKVYELLELNGGTPGASLGMLVVVGSAAVPAQAATPFQARTAYWVWAPPNAGGKFCYTGATTTPFPNRSVALKLRHTGTAGGEPGAWAISSKGVVKGCKPSSSEARVVGQVPVDQLRTAFQPTAPGATAWWTITTSDGSGSGAAWLAPHSGGGQDFGWAWQLTPNGDACPQTPASPVFTVPADGSILLTTLTAPPTFPCARVGVDLIP